MAGLAENRQGKRRFSHIAAGTLMLMFVALIYVWVQVNITKVNYAIAREMSTQERLLEETRQLRMEIETLESPRRIEGIARETLKMRYPETSQVVILHD